MGGIPSLGLSSYNIGLHPDYREDNLMNTTAPEEIGISAERLSRIRPILERYVAERKFAGFVSVIARRSKLVHFECVGMSHIEGNQPMQSNTLFRIYSMTKPIISIAMMMLYEEGRFHLDDPITKFIPAFKDV